MVALSAFFLRSLAAFLERCQCGGKLFVSEVVCFCFESFRCGHEGEIVFVFLVIFVFPTFVVLFLIWF